MTLLIVLLCTAALLAIAVLAVILARMAAANALVYGLCTAAALISLYGALWHLLGAATPRAWCCRSEFHGSARIFASMHSPHSFSLLSTSAPLPQAYLRSAMAAMKRHQRGFCRFIRRSWPA